MRYPLAGIFLLLAAWSTVFAQTQESGTVTQVTGTAPVSVANQTTTPVVSVSKADGSTDGYLSSADWATFNTKQSLLPKADASHNGYLGSSDWTLFNGKQATLSAASGSANGYLASGDWTAFNGKQTATLAHFNAWAGNSSNVAEAFDSTLLGDIKADSKHGTATMTLGTGIGGFQAVEVAFTAHGRSDGDKIYFTTTGALYQPLTASTTYYAYVLGANSLRVCATFAEAIAHANCNYSQASLPPTQSGTQTIWMGGLKLGALGAIPPANTLSLLGTNNARVLALGYDDSAMGNQSQNWNLPATFPSVGQYLQVGSANSPSVSFKWASPSGGAYVLAAVQCVIVGRDFTVDLTDSGNCSGGAAAYGYGTGGGGTFAVGDRILSINDSGGNALDGIYTTLSGDVGRAPDADTAAKLNAGTIVELNDANGSAFNHSIWTQTANIATIDVTAQNWQRIQTVPAASSPTATGVCTVASSTLSTTATNKSCTGIPASASTAVTCSGSAAFSTPTGGGVYARATGVADQIAMNTTVANTSAMVFTCSWVQP